MFILRKKRDWQHWLGVVYHYSDLFSLLSKFSLITQGILMTTQDIEDIDQPFIEKDWIGRGQIYIDNTTTIPTFVIIARSKVAEIPQNVTSTHLPMANLSVMDFLSCELPRVSSELISSKTAVWFNPETQNIPVDSALLSWSIPSPEFIKQLEDALGQAWFDGVKSVVDQRFNDGRDCLPLWIISYWREVARCQGLRPVTGPIMCINSRF
jgi:hypothetical protein